MLLPGDQGITKLFGFPGFEAMIKVFLKHINDLADEQGGQTFTYEQLKLQIEEKMEEIINA